MNGSELVRCPSAHARNRGDDDTTIVFSSNRYNTKCATDAEVHDKTTTKVFEVMLYSFQARSVVALVEFEGPAEAHVDPATRWHDVNNPKCLPSPS